MIEIWRDIKNYEGLYQVSNFGRVKSLNYKRSGTEGILTPKISRGYLQVYLCDRVRKRIYVHRLVAQAFIPNPQNLTEVNHKDEDKTNNRVENLEWCNRSYNINYGTRNKKLSKTILQYSIDGQLLREWESSMAIERATGFKHQSIIRNCRCLTETAYNYIWRYKE